MHTKALDLLVDDDELATRRQGWSPNPPRYTSGVLGKYAKLVQGAETGAITNVMIDFHRRDVSVDADSRLWKCLDQ